MIQVFAPGSIANLFVGFDILGLAFDKVGDTIEIEKTKTPGLKFELISNGYNIPLEIEKNTAGKAALSFIEKLKIDSGIKITVKKGIPLSSGLGGSAASAAGTVFALNELFKTNLDSSSLLELALDGEEIASGSRHADNLAPCLLGGLQLISNSRPLQTLAIPAPQLYLAVIHPKVELETSKARALLRPDVKRQEWILQSQKLATFIAACYTGNRESLKHCFVDLIIEPQRKHLIPAFDSCKEIAISNGALGYSISGAGPTTIAVCDSARAAEAISDLIKECIYNEKGISSDIWVSSMQSQGTRVL